MERPQEVADAGAVWRWVRGLSECNGKAGMLGHSAGAYVLCRVALEVGHPDAAVLQGALYRSIADLFRYNSGLVLDYMRLGEEQEAWVREHSPKTYEQALLLDAIVAAIERGDAVAEGEVDGVLRTRDLSSLQYDLDLPPEDQFRLLAAPTLVLHSSEDLNVPVEDAFDTVRALWAAGNRDVELRILPAANHSFQFDAEDYEPGSRRRSPCGTLPAPLIRSTRPSPSTTWRADSPNLAADRHKTWLEVPWALESRRLSTGHSMTRRTTEGPHPDRVLIADFLY